jgi:CBS-domain-containing membrane protein
MKTLIGPKTAAVLFALLILLVVLNLHGKALAIALVIVLGLAAKSYVEYLRRRLE